MKMAVLGDGGWGTTLAIHLHALSHRVTWWGAFPEDVQVLKRRRENVKFLPGIRVPRALPITADLAEAVESARIIVLAVPSQYLRGVVQQLKGRVHTDQIFVSAAKGIERGTLKRMTQILQEELAAVQVAALSGPNIAMDIAKGQPASSVVASANAEVSTRIQRLFMSERFRLYTSDDVIGVELGGALKNPVAIAAGIGDGLGFGANAKAALITRGIVEIARLGVVMGARDETFRGLSGLGDLITTCLGGRNRWLGEQLGKSKTLTQVLTQRRDVIEGVETAKAAVALARRFEVELPIIEQVHAILFRQKDPRRALQALMRRSRKAEFLPSAH
ncbi:MAG TPA: glycerol-3-phosphate dehydrogenase [Candidatus Omnitrophica bacterium]|nr:glycerol-3-phosphate dehydrogenase [Candidatus Omnitrophota bacterium]HBH96863.1 glycerol-3-phosphate dehydrogenase [Candidatus Omnitrophota bacterium]HBQ37723.1 glycerol-3-phosphate dehydrogenase [Candidatus Omnitrophota bacterium]